MTFQQLLDNIVTHKRHLVNMGRVLSEARVDYKDMVGEIGTWGEFLSQPEVGISTRDANSLVQLANYAEAIQVPIDDLNLATARMCANKGIYDTGLLPEIRTLTLKDFKERYADILAGDDNAPRTYTYMMMKRCDQTGNLYRVYDDELKQI